VGGGQDIVRGRFAADGDDAKLLEFGKGDLDQLICFVGISIEVAGRSAVRVGWDLDVHRPMPS
jgi:hypothetical protein